MSLPRKIKIVEVGARDGLQNEKQNVSVDVRVQLIRLLHDAGLKAIEAGAFVSPQWVPQMQGTDQVLTGLRDLDAVFPVLVPNQKGLELAMAAGAKEVAVFAAASESFSMKNINMSIDESLDQYQSVVQAALDHHIPVRGYVSCVVGCPYEGFIRPFDVAYVVRRLYDMGCYEISLGDTIGVGTPVSVRAMIHAVVRQVDMERLAGHFHDTHGRALMNIFAAMEMGMHVFDSSIAGLGGCPYADGATGNVATEDVVALCRDMDVETGVDLEKLAVAAQFISDKLARPISSRAGQILCQVK